MGRIPLFQRDVHTSVTSGARPATMAGAQIEETRTLLPEKLGGTGLEGASRMLPHPWPHAHCSASFGNPVVPSRISSGRLARCAIGSYLGRLARRRVRRAFGLSTEDERRGG